MPRQTSFLDDLPGVVRAGKSSGDRLAKAIKAAKLARKKQIRAKLPLRSRGFVPTAAQKKKAQLARAKAKSAIRRKKVKRTAKRTVAKKTAQKISTLKKQNTRLKKVAMAKGKKLKEIKKDRQILAKEVVKLDRKLNTCIRAEQTLLTFANTKLKKAGARRLKRKGRRQFIF